jgi:Asp-tRNA(Asn)/Glu-tRNA(Gln) amidotransferase A subunit family amidase
MKSWDYPELTGNVSSMATRLSGTSSPAEGPLGFDPIPTTIPWLQARMSSGQLDARSLLGGMTARALAPDLVSHRPGSSSADDCVYLNPTAEQEATASDTVRRARGPRGPLEGIPVLLTTDLPALGLSSSPTDSTVVSRLRAGGAVIVGATGSTATAARAVARALAQVAVCVDIDGAVVAPAVGHALVGMRPTTGLVSRTGLSPDFSGPGMPGPLTRHLVDAASVLTVLRGPDPADPTTLEIPVALVGDYALDRRALVGARLGLWMPTQSSRTLRSRFDSVLQRVEQAGAEVVEVRVPGERWEREGLALLADMRHREDDSAGARLRRSVLRVIGTALSTHEATVLMSLAGGQSPGAPPPVMSAAVAGCPMVTVPVTPSRTPPLGLVLFTVPWQDDVVLRTAYALEQELAAG